MKDRKIAKAEAVEIKSQDIDKLVDTVTETMVDAMGPQQIKGNAKEEIHKAVREGVDTFSRRFKSGYKVMLDELSRSSKKAKKDLKHFLPSEKAMKDVNDDAALKRKVDHGDDLAQIFGIGDDAINTLFDVASRMVDQERWDEAADALFSLVCLCPRIPLFWFGLGRCESHRENPIEALTAYRVAIGLDPTNVDIYPEAIDCCLEMHKPEEAQSFFDIGTNYVNEHKRDAKTAKVRDMIQQLKQELALTA